MKWSAFLDRPGTRLPCVPLPDARMENDFSLSIPYTLGYSATSKSTDSLGFTVMDDRGPQKSFIIHSRQNHIHWALPHHPMPFVSVFRWCNAWEICFISCKQKDNSTTQPETCVSTSLFTKYQAYLPCITNQNKEAWDVGVAPSV